jgi:hypothetical protein
MLDPELSDPDGIQSWLAKDPTIDEVVDRLAATRQERERFALASAMMAAWLGDRLHLDEGDDPVAVHRGLAAF